jgi:hypothetical protein
MANKVLGHYVKMLIALELDLLNKASAGKPLRVEIWTDFEPSDPQHFVELFKPSAEIDSSPMQGMFQLCAITSTGIQVAVEEDRSTITAPETLNITFIRATGGGGIQSSSFTIHDSVPQELLNFCRQTAELPVGSAGQTLKQPGAALSCIEFVHSIYCSDRYLSRLKPLWQLYQQAH